jgi:hypothetical protein
MSVFYAALHNRLTGRRAHVAKKRQLVLRVTETARAASWRPGIRGQGVSRGAHGAPLSYPSPFWGWGDMRARSVTHDA